MKYRLSMLAALALAATAWPQAPSAGPAPADPGAPFIREAKPADLAAADAGAKATGILDRAKTDPRYLNPKLVEIAQEHFQREDIPIEISDLPALRMRKQKTARGQLGGAIWRGQSPESEWDHSTFVIRKGSVTGTIRARGRLFTLFPAGNGLHVLAEVDQSKIFEEPPTREKNQNVEPR
jgi:hypothetical protein